MCALVLALRKIPIYAPGGGDSVLGSSDKPTYTVAVTDTEAAANREAFANKKENKRLVPSKKPDDPVSTKATAKEHSSTGININETTDNINSSVLRNRLSRLDETAALDTLNARHPAADTAQDPSDFADAEVSTSGASTPRDPHRSADLEEVRGLLHRQSTRGKRKAANGSSNVASGFTPRMDVEYNSYPPQTLDPYTQPVVNYEARAPPPQPLPQLPGRSPQMMQVPQGRVPVPGSGNAFAQQARENRY